MLILSLLLASFAHSAPLVLNPKLGKITVECKKTTSPAAGLIWIFKQWHLSPGVDTHDRAKAKKLPQALNQTALYRQLNDWVGSAQLKVLIAEGCTGELTQDSPLKINGWTMAELIRASRLPHYDDEVISSVAMKLEAKHELSLKTICGDDDALIRENLLAFSDARGVVGFLTRLDQYKADPVRAKNYLEGVVELYKLPSDTTVAQATSRLREELRKALTRVETALANRNEKAVRTAVAAADPEAVVVYGGMHAPGMVKLIEKVGLNCKVVEPVGYNDDEALLLARIHELADAPAKE